MNFERFKEERFKHYLENISFDDNHSDLDAYDYTSQKCALDLLARFNQYRQVVFISEGKFLNKGKLVNIRDTEIEVDFIDSRNVGRFQVTYKIPSKILEPDALNSSQINCIKKVTKVPVIPLSKFQKLLPLKTDIEFYPYHEREQENMYCSTLYGKFRDLKGSEIDLLFYDCAYILFDENKLPYRCLPMIDIIKPHLEKEDFSKGSWPLFEDHYGSKSSVYQLWIKFLTTL